MIDDTSETFTDARNYVSNFVFEYQNFNRYFLHDNLYRKIRERFKLPSQMNESVIGVVVAKYKACYSNPAGKQANKKLSRKNSNKSRKDVWHKVKFSKSQLSLVYSRDYNFTREQNLLSIGMIAGRIKVHYIITGMEKFFDKNKFKLGSAQVVVRQDKVFLHIAATTELPICRKEDLCHVVGIDRGLNFVAVSYDSKGSTIFMNGKAIKHIRVQYCKRRRQLQKKKKK